MKKESLIRNVYAALFLAALMLIFFPEIFWGDKVFISKMGDAHLVNYSLAAYFKNMMQQGIFPLWNPLSFCGTPFGADGYPNLSLLHLLGFWFNDLNLAWNVVAALNVFLAGFFTFLYIRQLGLHPAGGLLAGIIVAFAPSSGAYIDTWIFCLPLVLWLIEKFQVRGKSRYLLFAFAAMVFLFLNALPQYSFYVGAFVVAYVLLRFRSPAGIWLLIFAAGAISFHLVRLFELLQLSPRGHLWFINVLLPTHLVNFIFPYLYEAPFRAETNFFFAKIFGELTRVMFHTDKIQYLLPPYVSVMGISCVFLAAKGRGPVRFYLGMIAVILFYTMTFPFFASIYKVIPVLSQLPRLDRLTGIFTFSLAVLAAIGFDRCAERKGNLKPLTFFYATLSLLVLCVLLTLRLAVKFKGEMIRQIAADYIRDHVAGSAQYKAPLDFYYKRIDDFFLFIQQWTHVLSPSILWPVAFIFLTLLVLHLWQRGRIGRYLFWGGCLLVLFADLLVFFRLSPLVAADPGDLVSRSGLVRYLEADAKKEIFRVMPVLENVGYGGARTRDILAPNLNLIYGLAGVEGYDPLFPGTYAAFIKNFQTDYDKDPAIVLMGAEGDFDDVLADFLNVKYFVTKKSQKLKRNLPVVFEDDAHRLYRNPSYFPRAFLVRDSVVGKSGSEVLAILKRQKANLRHVAVLEERPSVILISPSKPVKEDRVIITRYAPHEVKLHVSAKQSGILVLSDNYFPGWRAELDGQPVKILRADYSFRAVAVPQGMHEVKFIYEPHSWRRGVRLSWLFLAAGCMVLLVGLCLRRFSI
ncbi:MAG: YfhO family protein [Candidatus Omnitrophica bacterium]|nr:YfhO family protein [Candidatus Omnitrophota bacterium]